MFGCVYNNNVMELNAQTRQKSNVRVNLARGLIAIVLFFNLQSAILFILHGEWYAPSFELEGVAGAALMRGLGILFLMWNTPYIFALWNPIRRRVSLIEACLMQAIGVIGELILLSTLPGGHVLITASTTRFIAFDASGLVALALAFILTRSIKIRSVTGS